MQIDTTEDVQTAIRLACRDLAAYWDEMIPRGVKARSTGTIGRSSERVDPVSAGVLDVRREALMTLNFAANVILTERDLTSARYNGDDAVALARLVDNHYDWLARHEMGWELAEELAEHARRIKGIAHRAPREQFEFVGPCSCEARIHAPKDALEIECPLCGQVTAREDLREAGRDVVRDVLCTAKEARQIGVALRLDIKPATVRKWAERERIMPLLCDLADHALRYRFGDIEALAARMSA